MYKPLFGNKNHKNRFRNLGIKPRFQRFPNYINENSVRVADPSESLHCYSTVIVYSTIDP